MVESRAAPAEERRVGVGGQSRGRKQKEGRPRETQERKDFERRGRRVEEREKRRGSGSRGSEKRRSVLLAETDCSPHHVVFGMHFSLARSDWIPIAKCFTESSLHLPQIITGRRTQAASKHRRITSRHRH